MAAMVSDGFIFHRGYIGFPWLYWLPAVVAVPCGCHCSPRLLWFFVVELVSRGFMVPCSCIGSLWLLQVPEGVMVPSYSLCSLWLV